MLAFMAEYFCMPIPVKAMSGWRSYLNDIGDTKSLYLEPLKTVRDAVTQFAYFEDEKGSLDLNAIDCFIAQADVLAYEPYLKEPDCPLRYLIDARSECYRVMCLVLGFLFDLRTEKQKEVCSSSASSRLRPRTVQRRLRLSSKCILLPKTLS
jgi:hypothetical protein